MEIDFVVYTDINNEKIFCYASFSISANKYTYDEYNELVDELLNFKDKEIKVRVIFKKNKAKKFKINISSIAIAYGDNRLNDLELLGWGLHNVWPIK